MRVKCICWVMIDYRLNNLLLILKSTLRFLGEINLISKKQIKTRRVRELVSCRYAWMIRRLCVSCLAFFRHSKQGMKNCLAVTAATAAVRPLRSCLPVRVILFCFATQLQQQKQQQTDKGNRSGNTLHPAPGTWHLKPLTTWKLDRTTLITLSNKLRDIHYTT